jgi:phage gp36-like protein
MLCAKVYFGSNALKWAIAENAAAKIAKATAQAFYSLKLRTQVRIQINYTCNIANFNLFQCHVMLTENRRVQVTDRDDSRRQSEDEVARGISGILDGNVATY